MGWEPDARRLPQEQVQKASGRKWKQQQGGLVVWASRGNGRDGEGALQGKGVREGGERVLSGLMICPMPSIFVISDFTQPEQTEGKGVSLGETWIA